MEICAYISRFSVLCFSPTSLFSEIEVPSYLHMGYVLFYLLEILEARQCLCLAASSWLGSAWWSVSSVFLSIPPHSFIFLSSTILLLQLSEVEFLESLAFGGPKFDSYDPCRRNCIFGAFLLSCFP